MAKKLKIRDLTLRDGHQSLFATRLQSKHVEQVIEDYKDGQALKFKIKQQFLGIDKMHMYDIYAPMESKDAKEKTPQTPKAHRAGCDGAQGTAFTGKAGRGS